MSDQEYISSSLLLILFFEIVGILLASSSGRYLLCHRQVVLPTAWLLLELLVEWLPETSKSLLLLALRHRIQENSSFTTQNSPAYCH